MKRSSNIILSVIIGIVVGTLNGFFGGGGGMFCVPMLENFLKYESKVAHATTMLIILPLSILSATIYLLNNNINFLDIFFVSFGVLIGGVIGAILLKKLPKVFIEVLFCVLMIIAGLKMIF